MDSRMRATTAKAFRTLILVMVVSAGVGLYTVSLAEELTDDRASRSASSVSVKAPTNSSASATADQAKLQRKLDEILTTQQEILKKLDEQHAAVMEELRIVKVRATIRSGS